MNIAVATPGQTAKQDQAGDRLDAPDKFLCTCCWYNSGWTGQATSGTMQR